MIRVAILVVVTLGALMTTGEAAPKYEMLRFEDLKGWQDDDHTAALSTFLKTCDQLKDEDWQAVCHHGQKISNAKLYFESLFKPVLISDGKPALFTGYYEPELKGSRLRTATYKYPLYKKPREVSSNRRWLSRKEIETQRALDNRGLELAWLNDPVEVFFLQVQGSGRIKLTDGNTMRVGFGGKNNHKYRSIGRELVRRGVFNKHQVSAGRIKSWVRQNPRDGKRLLQHNPSFVFFREITEISPKDGPIGAMGASVTTQRTLAVDPKYTPLGAPVWIEKDGVDSMARLMVAQDTGSAIKGAQRSDVFCGSGTAAGKVAGRMKDHGRMVVLLPALKAYELVGTIK